MGAGAYWSVSRIPVQGMTGCGDFQRSAPTGGAAKGMPLKEATPSFATPRISPPVTWIVGLSERDGSWVAKEVGDVARKVRVRMSRLMIETVLRMGLVAC